MKYSFATYLGTDSFLPGVLVLNESINKYNKVYGLVVLVSESVSEDVLDLLAYAQIKTKVVAEIKNPHDLGGDERGFKYMYTKLRLFEMFEFDKVVYIDADMLVCSNIEQLFDHPHMSAVIAGGLFAENKLWENLNAGLMVIEPRKALFDELFPLIYQLPSTDGSDQGFLQTFYKDWPSDQKLHLDHKFNTPFCYIDEYCTSHDFKFSYKRRLLDTNISVIHYWGKLKPWGISIKSLNRKSAEKWEQSLLLWWDTFWEVSKKHELNT